MGHMSSGSSDYLEDQSAIFDRIVQRYHRTITAQFYGHSHSAKFEVGYSDYSNRSSATANSISFIAPALTHPPAIQPFVSTMRIQTRSRS